VEDDLDRNPVFQTCAFEDDIEQWWNCDAEIVSESSDSDSDSDNDNDNDGSGDGSDDSDSDDSAGGGLSTIASLSHLMASMRMLGEAAVARAEF